ncbi:MAG: hypothetical protein H6831_02825 [Planctomycetes bacterium]|nr:hypothetical protein [Planctomycetota bacterium]MCB9903316.1 hypothetical protein [Planctomycetota bacterium]
MEAEALIENLCRRHGAAPEAGAQLLPLVRWALQSSGETRERVLELVERTLRLRTERAQQEAADDAVLHAVARVLHGWTPSQGILDLGGSAA